MISFNPLRLHFRLVASDFLSIVCILDGDRPGAVELTRLRLRPTSLATIDDDHSG